MGGAGLDFFYTVVFTEEISRVFSGGFGVIPLVTQYMSSMAAKPSSKSIYPL